VIQTAANVSLLHLTFPLLILIPHLKRHQSQRPITCVHTVKYIANRVVVVVVVVVLAVVVVVIIVLLFYAASAAAKSNGLTCAYAL